MNRYRTKLPRTALGLMAVAMSVITFSTLVVLPAQEESACGECQAAAPARSAVADWSNGVERPAGVQTAPEVPRLG